MNCVERIVHYANEVPNEFNPSKPEVLSNDWPRGEIKFVDYSMRYRPDLPLVLKNINLTISSGEKIGICGRTGSGKSSLLLSLYRMVEPASGSIFIDDIDIQQLKTHQLRNNVSIIPQEPTLFSGTIRSNLDPFDSYSDVQIWSALEKASMKDAIDKLEHGLEAPVVSGGSNFSVGQRQLLCLARAMIRKTRVIILDEATASVDMESDSVIQRTIREHFQNCTVLTIAHRLNTIMDYDRIMVLQQGECVEFDSPKQLVNMENGLFKSMLVQAGIIRNQK